MKHPRDPTDYILNPNTKRLKLRRIGPAVRSDSEDLIFHLTTADWTLLDNIPILHLHGITGLSQKVSCHVKGFLPYLYFHAPFNFHDNDLIPLQEWLLEEIGVISVKCEIIHRYSVYGYSGANTSPFIKVTINDPMKIHSLCQVIEGGNIRGADNQIFHCNTTTFESNLDFVLRCLIDAKITGANWIQLLKGTFTHTTIRKTRSHMEVNVDRQNIISHPCEDKWSTLPPYTILSFDIECLGRDCIFPVAEVDPVIQIANIISRHGESTSPRNFVFTLKNCASIEGAEVRSFQNEKDMLNAWYRFILDQDPDIITGYNVMNFDIPYLLNRAKALKIYSFEYLGRDLNAKATVKKITTTTVANGTRENMRISMSGRVVMDMFPIIQNDYKLSSYTLGNVATTYLGEPKDDVKYKEIPGLQNGSDQDRARLARYCLKDAKLPLQLMNKLTCLPNYVELARVSGLPLDITIIRGQQIRVLVQLYRNGNASGFIIPNIKSQESNGKFTGATVMEPIVGYYRGPVITLDFSSLYPSIMQAHNLCYSTLIQPEDLPKYEVEDYVISPNGDAYIKPTIREGLLPKMLTGFLNARRVVKAELKKETDPFKRAVLDGRQLALKRLANSVYGFTGAQKGYLYCVSISSSVTAYGRKMIGDTKEFVEQMYIKQNGYPFDAQVIYGDTDSVMIYLGPEETIDVETAIKYGREAAACITGKFINPINLEFEKVYCPYLLIGKKHYAGLYWTKADNFDKIDAKGIETVRRDKCEFVKKIIEKVLNFLLIDKNIDGAVSFVKDMVVQLLRQRIPFNDLIYTKRWSKLNYHGKQGHVELAARMRRRDPNTAPILGERIAYVILAGYKGKDHLI
jgi:DNA polymerase delta subunit 1